jgi:hypothetical protein
MAVDRHVANVMAVVMGVAVDVGTGHKATLYYNIASVYLRKPLASTRTYGRPIAITIAAATNGNGSDTPARNQTKRAGMKGISHSSSR